MKENLESRRTKLFNAAPAITLLLAITLSHSWPSGHFEMIPDLMIAIVFYWCVFRPQAPLAETFFFTGFIEDILLGTPLGFTSLIWLSIYFVTLTQARFLAEKNFLTVWVGFMFVAAVAYTMKVGIFYYFHGVWLPLQPIVFSYILSIGFYPLVARIVSLFNRYLHA